MGIMYPEGKLPIVRQVLPLSSLSLLLGFNDKQMNRLYDMSLLAYGYSLTRFPCLSLSLLYTNLFVRNILLHIFIVCQANNYFTSAHTGVFSLL